MPEETYSQQEVENILIQQQQQAQNYGQPLYQPQEDKTELLMYTFYHGDVISQLIKFLKGELKDGQGNLKVNYPLLNDRGISAIMVHIQLAISKLTNLSDINEEEVYRIAKTCEHNIINDLWVNKHEWALKFDLITLKDTIGDAVFLTLKRAEQGGDRTLIRGVHKSMSTNQSGYGGGKMNAAKAIMQGMFK